MLSLEPVYTNEALIAMEVSSDLDAGSLTSTYFWSVNSATVQIGNSATLDNCLFGKGDLVEVFVDAYDGTDTSSGGCGFNFASNYDFGQGGYQD